MDRTVDRTVIDRNTVPNLRKPYKIRWCTVITVPYRITVNHTVHRRVTTLYVSHKAEKWHLSDYPFSTFHSTPVLYPQNTVLFRYHPG